MLVLDLGPDEFDKLDDALNTMPVLLRYHLPSCGHCLKMKNEWNGLKNIKSLKGKSIAVIDAHHGICGKIKHKSGMETMNKGVPTIYYINGNKMVEYEGERVAKDMSDFVLEQLNQSGGRKTRKRKRKRKRKRTYRF
jgi:hypothetical protein